MKGGRGRAAWLVAVVLGVLTSGPAGMAAAPSWGPAAIGPVRVQGTAIVGRLGQPVFLRGVNLNGLVAYDPHHPEAVPITAATVAEVAAMGFDLVRLPLSLSALEPSPGVFSPTYLAAIRQVLDWAQADDVFVLLDLHQDHYAAGLFPGEADGMPAYMVDTLGMPTRPILFGLTDPAVQAAFTAFWKDRRVGGVDLQAAYLAGLAELARAFGRAPALAGYDVMNEPNPGLDLSGDFARRYLLPFYARAVAAIRALDPVHPIFLEPDVVSMAAGLPPWPKLSFLKDGVVLEPHEYLPQGLLAGGHAQPAALAGLSALYARSAQAAAADGLPWFVGEFGAPPTALGDAEVATEIGLQDRLLVGSAFWLWQIRPGAYDWNLVTTDGSIAPDPARLEAIASPHPVVVGGRLETLTWDPKSGVFRMAYRADPRLGPTVVVASSLDDPTGVTWQSDVRPQVSVVTGRAGRTVLRLWRFVLPAASGPVAFTLRPASAPGSPRLRGAACRGTRCRGGRRP
jgi:endoglycosylceramidase